MVSITEHAKADLMSKLKASNNVSRTPDFDSFSGQFILSHSSNRAAPRQSQCCLFLHLTFPMKIESF